MPLENLLSLIEDRLQAYIDSLDFGQSTLLKDMITYHMGWEEAAGEVPAHGKRIRPLLVLLCTSAFNGETQKALPAALSIEFLHNFTLIHDDIEDHSPYRHGRATLWKKWGTAQAINAGDALFSIAQMSVLDLRETCGDRIAIQAARKLNRACLHLTCGQQLDLSFEGENHISVDTYLDMIQGKTAALIALATALSGLVAEQNESVQNTLFTFGENLGMAFQIQDDALGIWGDPEVTGKSTASDIRSRKKSLPILYGLAHSPAFQVLWNKDTPDSQEINRMAELLEVCGARTFVQSKAEQYTQQAFTSLSTLFPKRNEYTDALYELSEKLLNRNF